MTVGSREFALVCACAIWPPSPDRAARIRRAAAAEIDPRLLVRVARRHGVIGLVADGLRSAAVALPGPLARIARQRSLAALRQAEEALRLDALFAAAGVPLLLLKGSPLAQRAYGTIAVREAVDIDLAVSRDDIDRAWRVMREAGYVTEIPARPLAGSARRRFLWAAKDSFHRHPDHDIPVELHWRLSDDLRDPAIPPQDRWQRIALSPGRTLSSLGDDDLFVYLCTHGAAHGWARLKWLADIAALIALSTDGGAAFWQAGRRAGAGTAVASALLLANQLLAVPLPEGFDPAATRRLRLLNRLALAIMTAGGAARELAASPYRGWAELTAKLLVAPGARNRRAVLRRLLISGEDVGALALPAWLAPAYPLLRVPLWLIRRARRNAERSG